MCFKNELLRQFFLNGKTLPVDRGQGVDQPIMQARAWPWNQPVYVMRRLA